MMNIKELIYQKTDQYLDEVTQIRRHLHRNPELSFDEKKTSEYIRDLLDQWNVSYTYPFVEHGILAPLKAQIKMDR